MEERQPKPLQLCYVSKEEFQWCTRMSYYWQYTRYVMIHKYHIFRHCLAYGYVWRGLWHDCSKFLPSEFFPHAICYGTKLFWIIRNNPNVKSQWKEELDRAWCIHQKRNKHHWQAWVALNDDGSIVPIDMPMAYRVEMLADWRGPHLTQGQPNLLAWYAAHRDKIILHPNTRAWVEKEMGYGGIEQF